MAGIGRTVLDTGTGNPLSVSYDGNPEWKAGGVTIAWDVVAAVTSDTTATEGFVVKSGKRYLKMGQPLCKITSAMAQIMTVTGSPTGGTFKIGVVDPRTSRTDTVEIAYNAAVATVQTALEGFYGSGNVTVSGSGALPSNAHTITFSGAYTNIRVPIFTLAENSLTGGSTPSVGFTVKGAVLTLTGTPTGGTMGFNVTHPTTGVTTAISLNYNSSVANTQTAIQAVLGTDVTVSGAGAMPGNAHTLLFTGALAGKAVHITLGTNGLTGGTTPTATVTASSGGASGKYGPFDPNASDGRQTLARDNVVILNEAVVEDGLAGLSESLYINTEQVGGIVGGKVWKRRLVANSSSDALATGPTYANLIAVMPRLELVGD